MFSRVAQRQAERLEKECKQLWITDNFMLTKEDLIGPDPSKVLPQCTSWERLQKMIGLDSVKESVHNFFNIIDTNYHQELQEKGPLQMSLNRVFLGSPERHILTIALGRKASSLPFLLANAAAIPHLVRYINATQRLKATFGEVKMPVPRPD
jgi:poly-D-alanine transfer protein DltD